MKQSRLSVMNVSLTVLHIKGVGGKSEGGAAIVALEAAAMEELPLCAQPLHHIHSLSTEKANVAAPDVDGELLSKRTLWKETWNGINRV